MNKFNPFQSEYIYRFYPSQSIKSTMVLVANLGNSFQIFSRSNSQNPKQLTNEPKGCLIANISTDGRFAFVYIDNSGKEQGSWYKINILTEEKSNLTPNLFNYTAFCLATSKQNPEILTSWILKNEENCILMVKNLSQDIPESRIIFNSKNELSFPIISSSGEFISFLETAFEKQILHIFDVNKEKLRSFEFGTEISKVNPVFFFNTTKILVVKNGTKNKRINLFDIDIRLFQELPITMDGDLDIIDFDSENLNLLFSATYQAEINIFVFDFKNNQIYQIGDSRGTYDYFLNGGYLLEDEVLIRWQSGNKLPEIRSINLKDAEEHTIFSLKAGDLNLPEFRNIKVETGNGLIQAWLMLPEKTDGPVPMIIDLHGGPNSCALDEFSSEAQYFTSKGFGICYLNYHGSSTFGTDFENSILGHPGKLEALDAVNLKNYLIKKGYADSEKIYLQGWSWGGFVSLLAAGLFPDHFKAFVSVMGIGDLISSYEDQHVYLQKMDDHLFGGSPQQVKDKYLESSPINYVKNITAPILIIHGKNDQHCPAKQMHNFINKLEESGKKYLAKWYEYGHLEMYSSNIVRESTSKEIVDFYNG